MSTIQNERVKLLATALNNIAVATFVTALIAPSASVLYGLSSPGGNHLWPFMACGWFSAALVLHLAAQLLLKRGLSP